MRDAAVTKGPAFAQTIQTTGKLIAEIAVQVWTAGPLNLAWRFWWYSAKSYR
jgi:hypothetical protein